MEFNSFIGKVSEFDLGIDLLPIALDREKAEVRYREALALAPEPGMRQLQTHCPKGLVALCSLTGQEGKTLSELTAAAVIYRSMEITFS